MISIYLNIVVVHFDIVWTTTMRLIKVKLQSTVFLKYSTVHKASDIKTWLAKVGMEEFE